MSLRARSNPASGFLGDLEKGTLHPGPQLPYQHTKGDRVVDINSS
jgi:hypothetical protein